MIILYHILCLGVFIIINQISTHRLPCFTIPYIHVLNFLLHKITEMLENFILKAVLVIKMIQADSNYLY